MFDLFAALDATDEQLDFPIIYGSAKQGWMAGAPDGPKVDMGPLFDLVLKHVEPPKVGAGGFRMLGTLLEANPYLGRIITGRVFSGSIRTNAPVKVLDRHGDLVETGRVSKILAFRGIEHSPIEEASRATSSPSRAWRNSTSPTRCAAPRRSSRCTRSRSIRRRSR